MVIALCALADRWAAKLCDYLLPNKKAKPFSKRNFDGFTREAINESIYRFKCDVLAHRLRNIPRAIASLNGVNFVDCRSSSFDRRWWKRFIGFQCSHSIVPTGCARADTHTHTRVSSENDWLIRSWSLVIETKHNGAFTARDAGSRVVSASLSVGLSVYACLCVCVHSHFTCTIVVAVDRVAATYSDTFLIFVLFLIFFFISSARIWLHKK